MPIGSTLRPPSRSAADCASDTRHRDLAVALLARAASAPGRFLIEAVQLLASSAAPEDPRGAAAVRRWLILEPDSLPAMDTVVRCLAARRLPVREAAWLWQSHCVNPGDRARLARAAALTHDVRWPAHGIAANKLMLDDAPARERVRYVLRVCELFGAEKKLLKDKPEERLAARAKAVAWGRSLVDAEPEDPRIWDVVVGMFKEVEDYEETDRLWNIIVRRFPSFETLHFNHGLFLDEQSRIDEALRAFRRAQVLKPNYAKASNLMSLVVTHAHQIDPALRYVNWAIATDPNYPNSWINYAAYLRSIGRYAEAIKVYEIGQEKAKAVDDRELAAGCEFNSGMSMISIGELKTGFHRIEARWATRDFPSPKRPFRLPIWRGPQVHPRSRLLVYMEQGLGDEIMLSWYFPLLRRDTARLLVDCDERLVELFARTYDGVEFVPRSAAGHDRTRDRDLGHKTPMLHVPQYYVPEVKFLIRDNWDWATRRGGRFPSRLAIAPDRLERWDRWLAERFPGRTRLSVSWRSRMRNRTRDMQYVSIAELAEAIPPGTVAINLQYSSTDEEIDELAALGRRRGFEVVTPDGVDLTNDLEDILALLQVSDAAVTPMISLAWMAGAVGCPAYVFRSSREGAIWQQFGTPFVPWGPSLRLFFRDPSEGWSATVRDLRARLEWFLSQPDRPARC